VSLFKSTVIIVNSRAVLEGARQIYELEKQTKEDAIWKQMEKEESDISIAQAAFQHWKDKGRKATSDGNLELNRKDAFAIARVLLLWVDVKIEVKFSSFKMVKDCVKWLEEIGRGTTWDVEREAMLEGRGG
jgi:hypothetical protein